VDFVGAVYCPYALADGSQRIRIREKTLEVSSAELSTLPLSVVKLLSKRWWIPIGTRLEGSRLEGSKLEPEGPRAEMGFSTTDQGFSAFRALCLTFMAVK